MVMIDQYIFGGFIASLFGFVLLYNLRRKTRKTKGSKVVGKDECINISAAGDGLRKEDGGDADIIIVGAGVAGAALAYTLGKVGKSLFSA